MEFRAPYRILEGAFSDRAAERTTERFRADKGRPLRTALVYLSSSGGVEIFDGSGDGKG